jgi:hypothetical protein
MILVSNNQEKVESKSINFEIIDNDKINLSDDHTQSIDSNWDKLLENNPGLYNGQLFLFKDKATNDNNNNDINFKVSENIDYKTIIGLRYLDGKNVNPRLESHNIRAMSCSIFIRDKDDNLILTERSGGDWIDAIDIFGGFVRLGDHTLRDFVENSLARDFTLSKEKIISVNYVTDLDCSLFLEQMIICEVKVNLSIIDLQKLTNKKLYTLPDNYEYKNHNNFFSLPLHFPIKYIFDLLNDKGIYAIIMANK